MFNKILDGCHVKKASLEHTVKHTFKLKCERTSEDVDVPQQPVQFLLQAFDMVLVFNARCETSGPILYQIRFLPCIML